MAQFSVAKLALTALRQTKTLKPYGLLLFAIVGLEIVQHTIMADILFKGGDIDANIKIYVSAIMLLIPVVRFGLFGNFI